MTIIHNNNTTNQHHQQPQTIPSSTYIIETNSYCSITNQWLLPSTVDDDDSDTVRQWNRYEVIWYSMMMMTMMIVQSQTFPNASLTSLTVKTNDEARIESTMCSTYYCTTRGAWCGCVGSWYECDGWGLMVQFRVRVRYGCGFDQQIGQPPYIQKKKVKPGWDYGG